MIGRSGANKFLKNISKKDRVLLIHHTDLDGIISGIFLYRYCLSKTPNVTHLFYSYKEKIKCRKYKKYNKIIFSDLSDIGIHDLVQNFSAQKNDILVIDHHQKEVNFGKNIAVYRNRPDEYIPCSRMAQELFEKDQWLAMIGVLADAGEKYNSNTKYIKDFMQKEKITIDWYNKNVVYPIENMLIYHNKNLEEVFNYILNLKNYKHIKSLENISKKIEYEINYQCNKCKNESEKLGSFNFYLIKSKFPIKSIVASKLSSENKDEVFIIATEEKRMIMFSVRSQRDDSNFAFLLKDTILDFKRASFGGHKKAAGGTFPKKYLPKFKKRLQKLI